MIQEDRDGAVSDWLWEFLLARDPEAYDRLRHFQEGDGPIENVGDPR